MCVHSSDFIQAILGGLKLRGITAVGINGRKFDGACAVVSRWLIDQGVDLQFRICPDVIHQTSRTVRDEMIPSALMLGLAHTSIPFDDMLYIDISSAWADEYLSGLVGGKDLWLFATDMFIGKYENPDPA